MQRPRSVASRAEKAGKSPVSFATRPCRSSLSLLDDLSFPTSYSGECIGLSSAFDERQSLCLRQGVGQSKRGGMNDLQQILVSAIQAQERGEIDEAVRLFKAALEIHPGHPAACYSLGVIAIRQGDHAEALHWADIGMAATPGYAPLRFLAGSALRAAAHPG